MESSSNPLIYLASASPRRSALLDQIGVPHRVQPVDVDETARGGEPPDQYVAPARDAQGRNAVAEACRCRSAQPVLGADTAVVLDDEILGKPRDEQDCLRMLSCCRRARTRCSPPSRCARPTAVSRA